MKHISILLLHHANLAGMENARQGFLEANNYLTSVGKKEAFNVELVALEPEIKIQQGVFTVNANKLIHELKKTDMIIIPPLKGELAEALQLNRPFIPWMVKQYKSGTELASLCLGAFLLGGTGLLNGRQCVTHWRAASEFKMLYPDIKLLTDKILTAENGIYTGGGAFSSANLVLYLIEKYAGRDTAIHCSKIFQIDTGRKSQSPFIIFSGQKEHHDELIRNAQEFIEKQYFNKITVGLLCEKFASGRRTFERRFKNATDNTVLEYIQRVRVEAAKKDLESGSKNINEVMYDVGYSDSKAFRDVFRKYAGISPVEYRNKYKGLRLH